MSVAEPLLETDTTDYPDGDGQPMSESPLHYQWIVMLKENIQRLLKGRPDTFCRADNFIYPVQYEPGVRQAPDVYVVFGRVESKRRTYRVWQEGGIFPQVIFEIMSPGNRHGKMKRKFDFYQRYGAEEYYVYDPYRNLLLGWGRDSKSKKLVEVSRMHGFVSPRLGIRFHICDDDMVVFKPDGTPFQTMEELQDKYELIEKLAAEERQRADRLAEKLWALGIDPNGDGHG